MHVIDNDLCADLWYKTCLRDRYDSLSVSDILCTESYIAWQQSHGVHSKFRL